MPKNKKSQRIRNSTPPANVLELAMSYLACGKLQEADGLYRLILHEHPNHFPSLANLGHVALKLGNIQEAVLWFERAHALAPKDPLIARALAVALLKTQAFPKAQGLLEALLRAAETKADAALHNYYGITLAEQQFLKAAIEAFRKAHALAPQNAEYLVHLAGAYFTAGEQDAAETAYQQALALTPANPMLLFNVGSFYLNTHRHEQAIAYLTQALDLSPRLLGVHTNLAVACVKAGKPQRAIEILQHAITLFPEVAPLRLNLGNAYKDIGEHAQALTQYRETLALDPEHPLAASNALFVMNHMPDITPQMIFTESKACGARFMTNILPRAPHANDRNPERPLKIGYVSGDFRKHPVQMYIEPVLAAHDTTQVQAYCYANHAFADEVTERIKAAVTQFRHIQDLSDAAVAELIRQDGIDILIDLSGHTSGNRLGVFARKPAPIQATWIGYGNTTGLPTMDYIIADRYVLPVEEEQFYTEKPLRLDAGYVCFLTPELPIEVNELPMLANGYPTFGCFNVRAKITPHVMRVWAEILKRLPHAKLHLKNRTFEEASSCEPFSAAMQGLGAKSEQLIFSGFSPPADYLAAHHSIDLMLDTFPYSAHTTARDALWMGVPMLTLRGDRWASHVGEGLLSTLGYPECIAQTTEEYIEKAVRFAAKPQALSAMRAELRPRLASAVMTQPKQFTRGYEAALRDIWRAWACNSAITP